MRSLNVVPAYGRDYKSKAAAIADWDAGKDFRITDYKLSGYINNADAKTYDIDSVQIRYFNNTRVATVQIKR